MSVFFKVIFWLQLAVVAILVIVNYFSYTNDEGLRFTIRGQLHAIAEQSDIGEGELLNTEVIQEKSINKFGVGILESIGSETIYFINNRRNGFMRIDYTDFSKAFTLKNISWFLFEVSILLLWLYITFQMMRLGQSLKLGKVFNLKNISRIKLIGLAFILIPFLQLARDQLFFYVAKGHIEIAGATLSSDFHWYDLFVFSSNALRGVNHSIFPSIILGLIVLLIAQVFKNGLELQNENELTI